MKKLASNRMLAFFLACIIVITTCLTVSISAVWDYDDPGTGMPDSDDPSEGLPYPPDYQSNPELVPDENNAVVKYTFSYVPTVLSYDKSSTITTAKAGDVVWLNISVKNINKDHTPLGISAFEGHVTFDVEDLSLFCYDTEAYGGDSAWMEYFTQINPTEGMHASVRPDIDWSVLWTPSNPAPEWQDDEIRGYGLHWGIAIGNVRRGNIAVNEDDSFVLCMPIKLNDDLVEGEEYTFTIPYPRYEQLGTKYVTSGPTQSLYARGGAYTITVKNHADVSENIATTAVYSAASKNDTLGSMAAGVLNDLRYPLTNQSDYIKFSDGAKVNMKFDAPADISSVTVTFNDTADTVLPTAVKVYGIDSEGNTVLLGTDTTGTAFDEGITDSQYYEQYFTDDENLVLNAANAYQYTVSFDEATYSGIYVEGIASDSTVVAMGEIEVFGTPSTFNVSIQNGTIENAASDNEYDFGDVLSITADVIADKTFVGWSIGEGSDGIFADASDPTTTFTVGATDAVITANYTDTLYKLTVENGTGDGEYAKGFSVQIVADPAPSGKYFSHWVVSSGNAVIDDINNSTTNVTTSNSNSTVVAVYSDNVALTVVKGTGSTQCPPGTTTNVSADVLPGFIFFKWLVLSGNVDLGNESSASTTAVVNTSATIIACFIPLHRDVPDNLALDSSVSTEKGSLILGSISSLNDGLYPLTTSSKWAGYSPNGGSITMVYALDNLYTVDSMAFTFGADAANGITTPSNIKIYASTTANPADRELIASLDGLTSSDWDELTVDYPNYHTNFFILSTDIENPIPARYIVVEIPTTAMMIFGETEIYGELSRFVVDISGGTITNATSNNMYLPGTVLTLVSDDAEEGKTFAGWTNCGIGSLDGNTFTVGEGDATITGVFVDMHKPVPDNLAAGSNFMFTTGSATSNLGSAVGSSNWSTGGYLNDQLYPLTSNAKWVKVNTSSNNVVFIADLNGAYDISDVAVTVGYDTTNFTMVSPLTILVYGMNSASQTGGTLIAELSNADQGGYEVIDFDEDTNLTSLACRYAFDISPEKVASYQYLRFQFVCHPMFRNTNIGEVEIYGSRSQFKVDVINGTQAPETLDNMYYPGDVITITADTIDDKVFSGWTLGNDKGILANESAVSTTFTVGIGNNTITANYDDVLYALTVENGSGDGDYAKNSRVLITADENTDPEKVFDKWVVVSGSATIASATSATTTVITKGIATIRATYKDRVYALTVENGTGSGNYANGTIVDIVANSAPADKKFGHWGIIVGSGTFIDANSATTKFTVTGEATTLRAVYVDVPYTVTVQGGTIVNPAADGYVVGTTIILDATVPEHKEFVRWEIVEGSGSFNNASNEDTSFTTGSGNTIIKAVYKDTKYTLTVVNGTGGGTFVFDDVVDIFADIPDGYLFAGWITDDNSVIEDANAQSTTVTIKGNATVTATFIEKEYTIDIVNGIISEEDLQSSYKKGRVVRIISDEPAENKVFLRWVIVSGSGTIDDASSATTTFTVGSDNAVIRAEYTDTLYALTVENGTGSGDYTYDTVVDIRAIEPDGYYFVAWVVDGDVTIENTLMPVTKVTIRGNAVVTATFAEQVYRVDVINGSIKPDDVEDSYNRGDVITIIADESGDNQHFIGWEIVNGNGIIADASSEITTVTIGTSDFVVRANFGEKRYTIIVDNGEGEGILDEGNFAGDNIEVTADDAPYGYVFDKWIIIRGEGAFEDESNSKTTFIVGDVDTVIKATYKQDATSATGDSGIAIFGLLAAISVISTAVVIKRKQR